MQKSKRITAILLAIFVTVLWASSWILIKLGLRDNIPALTFAGLRYGLAFVCLVPFILIRKKNRDAILSLSLKEWKQLILLGFIFYTLTQGAQFLGLAYLPAATLSLILGITPVLVGMTGFGFLGEEPSFGQWLGIALTILGVGLFFLPVEVNTAHTVGLLVALVGLLSNAAGSILGRQINRNATIPPLVVTFVSMGIGSLILLIIGGISQGFDNLNLQGWLLITWLALVNTALAFTLWNLTLQTLSAVESSVINGLIMPQIAILACLFLGETLSLQELAGIVLVGVGALIVQMRLQL